MRVILAVTVIAILASAVLAGGYGGKKAPKKSGKRAAFSVDVAQHDAYGRQSASTEQESAAANYAEADASHNARTSDKRKLIKTQSASHERASANYEEAGKQDSDYDAKKSKAGHHRRGRKVRESASGAFQKHDNAYADSGAAHATHKSKRNKKQARADHKRKSGFHKDQARNKQGEVIEFKKKTFADQGHNRVNKFSVESASQQFAAANSAAAANTNSRKKTKKTAHGKKARQAHSAAYASRASQASAAAASKKAKRNKAHHRRASVSTARDSTNARKYAAAEHKTSVSDSAHTRKAAAKKSKKRAGARNEHATHDLQVSVSKSAEEYQESSASKPKKTYKKKGGKKYGKKPVKKNNHYKQAGSGGYGHY